MVVTQLHVRKLISIISRHIEDENSTETDPKNKQHIELHKKYRLGMLGNMKIHYENMSVQYEAISKSGKMIVLDVKM